MAAIQSAERRAVAAQPSGIRPFDLGRDLRAVADLIADAFRTELDARGAAALREVRNMSRMGGLIRLLNLSTSELDGFFGGFVWVEADAVVGNITVQKGDKFGSRWQIANVAVAPEWRGRSLSSRAQNSCHSASPPPPAARRLGGALDWLSLAAGRCVAMVRFTGVPLVALRTALSTTGFPVEAGRVAGAFAW